MRKIPHFYKFHSRAGLKYPPIHTTVPNIGVEDGPDAVLDPEFLSSFSPHKVETFVFSDPQKVPDREFISQLVEESSQALRLIAHTFEHGESQVVVGGDHSVAFPSILAVLDRVKTEEVGYVQIDSHTDMNRYDESISKNWHGMYLRPLLDGFDLEQINALVKQKLTHENVTFIGNLDADPAEWNFFREHNLTNITAAELRKDTGRMNTLLDRLSKLQHLHLSIDIDGFDSSIAPATGLPARGGLLFEDVKPLFDFARRFPSVSIDLVEVNPKKEGAEKTVKLAQQILHSLLS